VGVVEVGYGFGLVLGDEPAATTWLARPYGGILARWEYAESEPAMDAALERIPGSLAWAEKGTFTAVASPLQLFNSAEPGDEVRMPRLPIPLPAGSYRVRWVRYAPDPQTAASLIELRDAAI
jgi:hypothetical protein